MSPLTPRLEDSTRLFLLEQLCDAGFPEVGQNSLVIGISAALGFQAADAQYESDLPYDHLPKVQVAVTRMSEDCCLVEAVATGSADFGYGRTVVTGTYCLVGTAQWKSGDQQVSHSSR